MKELGSLQKVSIKLFLEFKYRLIFFHMKVGKI